MRFARVHERSSSPYSLARDAAEEKPLLAEASAHLLADSGRAQMCQDSKMG